MGNKTTRRDFIRKSALGAAGLGLSVNAMSAKSYNQILGANDRIRFGVAGLNGRGKALTRAILSCENTQINSICDVDSRILDSYPGKIKEFSGHMPKTFVDFRAMVASDMIDAVAIATPDHWHAPMAIMGLQNGKQVYIEKPCCHNPAEGEMLIEATRKYGLNVQMGNQQRSAPTSIQAIKDIRNGIIGHVYYGKAWYANNRGPIGKGKKTAVPEWLDWELFQGPAPREDFRDNIVHYNWHWFWNWGTGEINNNGTHELDICRWALGVEYPTKVTSSGGRYQFQDDWQFYDTQVASFEFEGGKMITWEGKSCNGYQFFERGRGVTIHGTEGTIMLDRNAYQVFDKGGTLVKMIKERKESATTNTVGRGGLDDYHMANFCDGIRKSVTLNAEIEGGYKSNLLAHLGNMAQEHGQLNIDSSNGHVIGNDKASAMWSRDYEEGWAPKV